ncbi:Mce protein [Mycobacterium sp. ENV421]|uniref:Mce protein n=1 Tax=Mycobacterium sp. ENV421 TaxID=1213407 RepID=UPI000C9C3CE5|nr:Mce protein [Mycobacterium sp. ENV421]PND54528.1 Mce protein [Mycobacterium sp. ENV421]
MEANAGTSGLSEPAAAAATGDVADVARLAIDVAAEPDTWRRSWHQHRRWLIASAAALILLALGTGFAGYKAVHAHRASEVLERANAAAISVAKDCVAATQPPDKSALPAAQRELIECSTGNFGAQAAWYAAVLEQAYQAADVHVQLAEMHAAIERNNDDGSVVALLAFRSKVSQPGMADRENSYRVRVKMVSEGGQFKVAELDQVAK